MAELAGYVSPAARWCSAPRYPIRWTGDGCSVWLTGAVRIGLIVAGDLDGDGEKECGSGGFRPIQVWLDFLSAYGDWTDRFQAYPAHERIQRLSVEEAVHIVRRGSGNRIIY